ncbi:glutaredoxin [Acrasis kona]|uniref:Glutaredoxin n=1 Tax=Acrasis kona TaxID=1008807 RepID=A0AAW2ZI09_9EUKA
MTFTPSVMEDFMHLFSILNVGPGIITRVEASMVLGEIGLRSIEQPLDEIFLKNTLGLSWIEFVKCISRVFDIHRLQLISIARRQFDKIDIEHTGALNEQQLLDFVDSLITDQVLSNDASEQLKGHLPQLTWPQILETKFALDEILSKMDRRKKNEDYDELLDQNDSLTDDEYDSPRSNTEPTKSPFNVPAIPKWKELSQNNLSPTLPTQISLDMTPTEQQGDLELRIAQCFRKEQEIQYIMATLHEKEASLIAWEQSLREREAVIEKREKSRFDIVLTEQTSQPAIPNGYVQKNALGGSGKLNHIITSSTSSPQNTELSDNNNSPTNSESPIDKRQTRKQTVFDKAMNFFKKREIDSKMEVQTPVQPPVRSLSARHRRPSLKKM